LVVAAKVEGKVDAWVKAGRAADLMAKETTVVKLAGRPARAVKAEMEARVDGVGMAANAAWYQELREDNLDSRHKILREGIWLHPRPTFA
jgi:hypothetical protein